MDLSESMSNYLRLSNNCCEKCLANTEISSRNCAQLYYVRLSPFETFQGPWGPRAILWVAERHKKRIYWYRHIFRLFNKTSDINRNITNLFTNADTANANLTSLRMKIDDIQVKINSKTCMKIRKFKLWGRKYFLFQSRMEQMMSGIEKSKTDFVAFRGSKMISSTPSNPGIFICLSKYIWIINYNCNLVTYRFVDFNVGGAFDKSYFTAPFRGIYAFSAQIGTKKRVNTYIFMKVITAFLFFKPSTWEHHGRRGQEYSISGHRKFELVW